MRTRELGRSGILVSEIGFGCGFLGHARDFDYRSFLNQALDLGITFYDTSDFYGDTECWLGEAFRSKSERVVIATKFGMLRDQRGAIYRDFSVAHMFRVLEASLRRLRRESIDVFQLHSPTREVLDDLELLDALRQLKRAGKIRAFGLSLYGVELAREAIVHWQPDALQIHFNLFNQEMAAIFAEAVEAGVGLIARRPMDGGMLGGELMPQSPLKPGDPRPRWGEELTERRQKLVTEVKFLTEGTGRSLAQAALVFILSHPAITTAIPSTVNPVHLRQNVAAAGKRLSETELTRLAGLMSGEFATQNLGF